jgi:hypothetical protein
MLPAPAPSSKQVTRAAGQRMEVVPREPRNAIKPRKYREKREISVAHLPLEDYNEWQRNRSEIRQWLVEQIAERAIKIFRDRRKES